MDYFIWNADPLLVSFLGLKIHWYGALFATAILSGLQVMKHFFQKEKVDVELLDNLLMYGVIGIIVGARLVHCFFYEPSYYLSNPLKILAIWEGGLASHGGGLGLMIAAYLYNKHYNLGYVWLLDRLAISTALFGFFVRMGNFVNSEIIGIETSVPWAVVFERIDPLPRHPVQLYEALVYLSIFIVLFSTYKLTKIKQASGALLGLFLILVFTARIGLEFVKVRQASYGHEFVLSTGQWLSVPFFITGCLLLAMSFKKFK